MKYTLWPLKDAHDRMTWGFFNLSISIQYWKTHEIMLTKQVILSTLYKNVLPFEVRNSQMKDTSSLLNRKQIPCGLKRKENLREKSGLMFNDVLFFFLLQVSLFKINYTVHFAPHFQYLFLFPSAILFSLVA